MIRSLDIHLNAKADILRIRESDVHAAAAIIATLEQIKADPLLIDKLTTHGDVEFGAVKLGVKRWESARRKGNLWRFRALDPSDLSAVRAESSSRARPSALWANL